MVGTMSAPKLIRHLAVTLVVTITLGSPHLIAEEDAFDALDRLLDENFDAIDRTLEEQFELLDQAMEDAYQKFSEEIKDQWGEDEIKLPSKKEWVDYSDDLKTRRRIDFEKGVVKLERLINLGEQAESVIRDMQNAASSLKSDTLADLANKDHAVEYARESLSEEGIELSAPAPETSAVPVLEGIDQLIPDTAELAAMVSQALNSSSQPVEMAGNVATVTPLGNNKVKVTVEIPLASNYRQRLSARYESIVMAEAKKQDVPPSLLFAVMETESAFNPRATSAVPAYGLMQLVPRSGAMDAYNYVYGEKTLLDPEYLYQPFKNVELGSAYLNILLSRYLRAVENPLSRKYCAIAAYNTGSGNVAKAFTGKRNIREAAKLINSMQPQQVYDHLKANLPYEETRHYIEKVTKAQKKYLAYDRTYET